MALSVPASETVSFRLGGTRHTWWPHLVGSTALHTPQTVSPRELCFPHHLASTWRMASHLTHFCSLPSTAAAHTCRGCREMHPTHPAPTVSGSTPARGLVLAALSLGCRAAADSQEDREVHRPPWPQVPSGRSCHFPVETGPDHWAPCVLLQNATTCRWFEGNHPGPRVWVQTQLTGAAADSCAVVRDPGRRGLRGGEAEAPVCAEPKAEPRTVFA